MKIETDSKEIFAQISIPTVLSKVNKIPDQVAIDYMHVMFKRICKNNIVFGSFKTQKYN